MVLQGRSEAGCRSVAVGVTPLTRRCRARVRSDAFSTRSVISSNRPNDRPGKGGLGGLAMEGVVLQNGWTLRRSALERIEQLL
jgi:hypothetical protein